MSETKQAMQNTIKNLQAKSDNISKLEDKGSRVVVLQLGSHSIKMGFANEKVPFSISPFIAYALHNINHPTNLHMHYEEESCDHELFKSEYRKVEQTLKSQGVISADNRPFKGKPRSKQIVSIDRIPQSPPHTTLYGDQALRLQLNPNYLFYKIIQHSALNITPKISQSKQISNFQNLIVHLMRNKMKIPQSEWSTFNCIFIVPDVFVRKHIKSLVYSLFSRIGFKKMYIHLESVMACFGTAVSSACVLDIGHQKISVCCVDQGVILPNTLIRKNFGSKHLSHVLARIFNDRLSLNDPTLTLTPSQQDLHQLDYIKQIACEVRQPQQTTNRIYQINLIRHNTDNPLQIPYHDSICIAANSYFSNIFNSFSLPLIKQPFDSRSPYYDLYEDSDDYFEQFSGGGQIYQATQDSCSITIQNLLDPFIYVKIQDMLLGSLLSIKDTQVLRKFTMSVLVIGGGAHMHKLVQEIINGLNKGLQKVVGGEQRAELATDLSMREIPPIYASWLGGTVIPKLDSLRDLWIEKNKFLGGIVQEEEEEESIDKKLFTRKEQSQQWGIRYLKQKVPFLW